MSRVSVAAVSDIIIAQRGFQFSARVVQVSDEVEDMVEQSEEIIGYRKAGSSIMSLNNCEYLNDMCLDALREVECLVPAMRRLHFPVC